MSSKARKGKKKTKTANDVIKSKESATNKNYAYFTNEEILELKTIMKIKDVTSIPLPIAATVINRFELLKKIIQDGNNINQTGQNNMTALMWAVKYKHLDIVDYLLTNGCDPTIKTDSGDNVLILALEHKLWNEEEVIDLWKSVKRVSFVDVNFTNKNGHNLLHMCVRRDWEQLLKLLLDEKPNIDAGNSNGVTPLMLACFRNNINIIEILMNAGANILKEDNHGRMTLCYAISSVIKINKPPFLATAKIIAQLKKHSLLENYLKRRLELIIATVQKPEISCATSEMLINIVQFAVQFIEESIGIFLECDVFVQLLEVLEKRLDNISVTKFLLLVCEEILFYNEQSLGYKPELYTRLLDSFYKSGWINTILEILRRPLEEAKIAFNLLILSLTNEERFGKIIQENKDVLLAFLTDHQTMTEDENRIKILKNRRRRLKRFFDSLDISALPATDFSERVEQKKKSDANTASKKSRRRSKAIRAKLTKIKSAELTKRLNLNGKKINQAKSPRVVQFKTSLKNTDEILEPNHENLIAASFGHLLEKHFDDGETKTEVPMSPKWQEKIVNLNLKSTLVSKNFPIDVDKLHQAVDHLNDCCRNQKYDSNVSKSINIVVDYLRQSVQMLVRKYQEYWENDRTSGNCSCVDLNEHVPWLYSYHLKNLEVREKQILQDVQNNFEQLIKTIKDLANKNLNHCLDHLNKLEATILNYEIRGIKMISYISGMETYTLKYSTHNPKFDNKSVLHHVQNLLNNKEEPRNDILIELLEETEDISFVDNYKSETPINLYHREMSLISKPEPKNKRKEIESKLNTIANGFHLINSIMSICDESSSSDTDLTEEQEKVSKKKKYTVSDLNYTLCNKCPKTLYCPDISEIMPKGLMSQIASLKQNQNYQTLLNGEIRTAIREKRNNYLISAGTNFAAPELGLDINGHVLAVRRIPKDSWYGKLIKTLVEPLLGLVHTHILHYFACEFDENELILATPICKWNLGQYMQLLKQCNMAAMPARTVDVIRQFLNGLAVLHKYKTPIVHGNLKPSNIFVDFSGLVKIAEFGLYKALYKIIEAPNSSLIWFAKETLQIYRNSSIIDCSVKSDIHVAGMLIYFVLSGGKHFFGEETQEILRNIKRGNPKLNTKNFDLKDLLLWMTHGDCNQRPNVEQVLSHPLFWTPSKKWSFILCCSGVNHTEYIINTDKLYRSIDTYCCAYLKIDWNGVIKSKLPNVEITEDNTIIGLLKFIRNYHEKQNEVNLSDPDLSCAILSLFPELPSGLYRTLLNTNWLKHAIFMKFAEFF